MEDAVEFSSLTHRDDDLVTEDMTEFDPDGFVYPRLEISFELSDMNEFPFDHMSEYLFRSLEPPAKLTFEEIADSESEETTDPESRDCTDSELQVPVDFELQVPIDFELQISANFELQNTTSAMLQDFSELLTESMDELPYAIQHTAEPTTEGITEHITDLASEHDANSPIERDTDLAVEYATGPVAEPVTGGVTGHTTEHIIEPTTENPYSTENLCATESTKKLATVSSTRALTPEPDLRTLLHDLYTLLSHLLIIIHNQLPASQRLRELISAHPRKIALVVLFLAAELQQPTLLPGRGELNVLVVGASCAVLILCFGVGLAVLIDGGDEWAGMESAERGRGSNYHVVHKFIPRSTTPPYSPPRYMLLTEQEPQMQPKDSPEMQSTEPATEPTSPPPSPTGTAPTVPKATLTAVVATPTPNRLPAPSSSPICPALIPLPPTPPQTRSQSQTPNPTHKQQQPLNPHTLLPPQLTLPPLPRSQRHGSGLLGESPLPAAVPREESESEQGQWQWQSLGERFAGGTWFAGRRRAGRKGVGGYEL